MSDSGITREEAEAMGLIDHDEEARRHAAAVEELTRLRNEHEASRPASPSGNRHDGVALSKLVDYTPTPVDVYRPSRNCGYVPTHVAHPVDIDAARTAVIEAAIRSPQGFYDLDRAIERLYVLTTKETS